MRFRMLPIVAAIAVGAALSGCSSDTPIVTPKPQSSATPVFSSDEEALAAATDAYAKYLAVSDEIFIDGGANSARLAEVLTGDKLDSEVASFADFASQGLKGVGSTSFDAVRLQQYDRYAGAGERVIVVYLCEDISKIDIVDHSGKSVVSEGRPDRVEYEVAFDLVPPASHDLLVSAKVPWSDKLC